VNVEDDIITTLSLKAFLMCLLLGRFVWLTLSYVCVSVCLFVFVDI